MRVCIGNCARTVFAALLAATVVGTAGCGDETSNATVDSVGVPTMVGFVGARQQDPDYSFFTLNLATGKQIKLAPAFTMLPSADVWSPDGTLLAYVDRDAFPAHAYWMAMIDANGDGQRKITDLTEYVPVSWSWSADGKTLIALSVVGGKAEPKPEGGVDERHYTDLFGLDLPTGQMTRLTDTQDIGEWAAHASPDGKKIAFAGTEYDAENWKIVSYGIYSLDSNGANQKEIVRSPTHIRSLRWSPDGKKIVYCTDDGKTGIDSSEIHVVDVKTGADVNLTGTPSTGEVDPSWSPDGKKIAFYSGTSRGGFRLRITDSSGANPIDLTEPGEYGRDVASWSPDGKSVLYTDRTAIYSVGVDGKDRKLLLDGKDVYRDIMSPVWLFDKVMR